MVGVADMIPKQISGYLIKGGWRMNTCFRGKYWDDKRIGFRNKSYDPNYCWCYKQLKHTDTDDSCNGWEHHVIFSYGEGGE